MTARHFLSWAVVVLVVVGGVEAALLPVTNASFEADSVPDGGFPVSPTAVPLTLPVGWGAVNPDSLYDGNLNSIGVVNPTGTTFFSNTTGLYVGYVPDGSNAALTFLGTQPRQEGEMGLGQVLGSVLTANTRYTLSVWVGNIASGTGLGTYAQFGFFDLDGFPGYRVELLAGGVMIGEDDNLLDGSIPEGEFRESSFVVDIGAGHAQLGQALEIRLINLNHAGTVDAPNIEVDFDDVRLDATGLPVPEPGSLAGLLVVWTMGMLIRRRRRVV